MRLRGDVLIAAVCGEIEKTQYGDAQGGEYRGYAAGYALPRLARRRRRHVPARRADRGQGRARPLRRALAAHPRPRQLHPHRVQRGEARPELDPAHARGDRARCSSGSRPGRTIRRTPTAARRRSSTSAPSRAASAGASRARRTTPISSSTSACRRRRRWASRGARCSTSCARSPTRFPDYGIEGEVYVTAPGAEIDEGHELVAAIDASHEEVFGEPPGRDVTRWFSDALGADALRHPDRQLRHVDRADGRRARRESRDRRTREDGATSTRSSRRRSAVDEARHLRRRQGRPHRRRGDRPPRRADDARVLRARRRGRRPPSARRSPRRSSRRRSSRRSSSTPRATSASTRRSRRTSTGRTRSRRGSTSSRTSTRSSAPTSR